MALLCVALLAVKWVPFRYWRGSLGQDAGANRPRPGSAVASARRARRIAVHVERGAARLPFATKCLPRAMALCWLLRSADIAYVFRIAARPAAARQASLPGVDDTLHAWVDAGNVTVIGDLPGPWVTVLSLCG